MLWGFPINHLLSELIAFISPHTHLFFLTFLILIQAIQQLTVIYLKNISVCPPRVQGRVWWIPLVVQTHVFVIWELITHCFILSPFLKCLETTHLQDTVFRNNANVARRYTNHGVYNGKFCVVATCVERSLISQPRVKHRPYHVVQLAWQRIQVHEVARANMTSKRVPWRPPSLWKYHHRLKSFRSRLRILSNKVEWGDKKPKQQEAIFPTGVHSSPYTRCIGGEGNLM